MRRTYKSKKDAVGALDPKEIVFTGGEKSSAFDAYYIQNIKQTRRELSCFGSTNMHYIPTKKSTKRKFVKRLIKDVDIEEPNLSETTTKSTYLTPDKSIRVNKAPDPFDLLLNSPASQNTNAKNDPFDKLIADRESNKSSTPHLWSNNDAKMYNCSSDSESEKLGKIKTKPKKKQRRKSNKKTLKPLNETDMNKYELIVEQKPNNKSVIFENSINNLVIDKKGFGCLIKKFSLTPINKTKRRNNRLTVNSTSPTNGFPLTSTPFLNRYCDKSIYKYSPINMTCNNDNHVIDIDTGHYAIGDIKHLDTVRKEFKDRETTEDILYNNVTIRSNDYVQDVKNKEKNIETDTSGFVCTKKRSNDNKNTLEIMPPNYVTTILHALKNKENSLETDKSAFVYHKKRSKDKKKTIENDPIIKLTKLCNDQPKYEFNEKSLEINKSSFVSDRKRSKDKESTDTFISNANLSNEMEQLSNVNDNFNTYDNDDKQYSHKGLALDENTTDNKISEINNKLTNGPEFLGYSLISKSNNNTLNGSIEMFDTSKSPICSRLISKPFLGFTNIDSQSADPNTSADLFNSISGEIDNSETSLININSKASHIVVDESVNLDNASSSSNESFYDACSNNSVATKQYIKKQPIVQIEKLRNSLLNEVLNKQRNASVLSSNKEYSSISSHNDDNNSFDNETIKSYNEANSYILNKSEANESIVQEKHVSFVTTRRRNEISSNDSIIFLLNDLDASCSSKMNNSVLVKNDNIEVNNELLAKSVSKENKNDEISDNICRTIENEQWPSTMASDSKITVDDISRPSIILEPKIKWDASSNIHKTLTDNNKIAKYTKTNCRDTGVSEVEYADEEADVLQPIEDKLIRPSIVLQPGKKWERSLSIYRRMTTVNDHLNYSVLDDETTAKGRKYNQSIIDTMELQEHRGSIYNNHLIPRNSITRNSIKSAVKLSKVHNSSRFSISTTKYDDLSVSNRNLAAIIPNGIIASHAFVQEKVLKSKCMHLYLQKAGFLSEDCDDTLIELSKLSIADSDHEVTVLEKPSRIVTARDYVLRRCNQTDAVLFDECYPDTLLKNCHKIGEGVYGEVFLWRSGDGVRVLKVVPVAGNIRVNGEAQKNFHEIISEIVIAMELSALRAPISEIESHFDEGKDASTLDLHCIQNATDAFNEVLAVKCVFGNYPSRLLDLWDLYDECKGSENDNPAVLPVDQQYIVLELANAGQDLESYQFNSAEQAYALFIQVAFALAVGEEAFQFEHRDLHWGNVLISTTEQKFGTFVLRGRSHRVPRCGVRATVIDYSLSRLSLPLSSGEPSDEAAALYNDLGQDEGLFDAVGDYQFEVYRLMREKLGNDWKLFEPYTNIVWLHYTVDKMITALRYKRTNTKVHKQYITKLKGIKNRILNYGSAVQFVLTDNEY